MPSKGDTGTIDERNSDELERPLSGAQKSVKPQENNKNQILSKNNPQAQTRKKTVSHHSGINNLDALVNKSAKLQLKSQKEALVTSTDSGVGGAHKKPRQPKQRVGINSKVSSSEKESNKDFILGKICITNPIDEDVLVSKAKVTNPRMSPSKGKTANFQVIVKGKNEKPAKLAVKDDEKDKEKIERKAKRDSVRQQIKAAKTKVNNPPMVFAGVKEDENAKQMRGIQRTPPKARQPTPPKGSGAMGGGMVSRDDQPSKSKVAKGPVQRSPPRKIEENNLKVPSQTAYDYKNVNTANIERKDKITRSPVSSKRNQIIADDTPPKISEKQMSVPIESIPVRLANDFRHSPDYGSDAPNYEQFTPQKQSFYPSSPKTFQHTQDPSELYNFEDRVDDLLSETRNKLDDFTPKVGYSAMNSGLMDNDDFGNNMFFHKEPHKNSQMSPPLNYAQMAPQMMQAPMYGQAPYNMGTYYAPVPMNQNMMPGQQMMQQPGMYGPAQNYGPGMNQEYMNQHMYQQQPQAMMQQPGMYAPVPSYGPPMSPDNMSPQMYHPQPHAMVQPSMGMPGQPMYQVFYPPANQGSPQQPQYPYNQF